MPLVRCAFENVSAGNKTRRRPRVARYTNDYVVTEEAGEMCVVRVEVWLDESAARADAAVEFL